MEFSSVRERYHYKVFYLFLCVVVSEKSFVNAHVSCITTEVFETVSNNFFFITFFDNSEGFFLGKTIFELVVSKSTFFEDYREFAFEDKVNQCVCVRAEVVVLFLILDLYFANVNKFFDDLLFTFSLFLFKFDWNSDTCYAKVTHCTDGNYQESTEC